MSSSSNTRSNRGTACMLVDVFWSTNMMSVALAKCNEHFNWFRSVEDVDLGPIPAVELTRTLAH